MKFVYFGYDFMLHGAQRLIDEGHELAAIFTFECDNVFNFNTKTLALARGLDVPLYMDKPQGEQIESLTGDGVEVFLAAGYPFKIPTPQEDTEAGKAYGVNCHPSLLPKGRGLMPTPYIIMREPEAAGVTLHKMTSEFDGGDVLLQEAFDLSPRETVESYSARVTMAAPDLMARVFEDLSGYWRDAKPQDSNEATYFPPPSDDMRMLDPALPVAKLEAIGRAFGHFGALANFDGKLWAVYDFDGWEAEHNHDPGAVVQRLSRSTVIAVSDGFLCLNTLQPIEG